LGGGTLGLDPQETGVVETRYSPPTCDTIPTFVALDQTVWAKVGVQKKFGAAGAPPPKDGDVGDP